MVLRQGRILATLIEKSKDQIVVALPELSHTTLDMLIDYCNFMLSASLRLSAAIQAQEFPPLNSVLGALTEDARDENKREAFEARFLAPDTDQAMLCELASASYYLDFRPLVNLTSRIIAAHISGKSPQQLRAALGFDTLEAPEAPRHDRGSVVKRLHKRLEQKHRDGSRELGVGSPVQSHSTPAAPWPAADALASIPAPSTSTIGTASNRNASDERSLEELLSFIEDGSDDKKKKKRRGKKKTKRIKKDEGEGSEALHLEPDVATENLHHPAEDASDPDDAPSLGVGPAVVDSATLSGRHVASMRESQDETSPATATDAGPEQPPYVYTMMYHAPSPSTEMHRLTLAMPYFLVQFAALRAS
ncbi:uncharacterized protein MONBRDRAFT_9410 [Monosiga brevicollis MX1]|uniref:SKP1 component dimerisation domain-containing protein n=1 Tax=Monosiga brevicollis TaxID=81824 RepID=A9V323_MONBE|nr:uncharacterized protein MONBRDRAFT_9410 [Monosiga brevicollis MX1]EDQ88112.1 predicted protein [Monosiga brevicollis MX1]|eukprot:XP_001747188.1 hypothetical protein [Monosiga brevicollis MX1]